MKPSAAILSVIKPFASKRTTADQSNVPINLLNFHSSSFVAFLLEDLKSVELDLSTTIEEQLSIERLTRSQSKSDTWYKLKSGRISCTTLKLACNTSIGKPCNSLIIGVCYPTRMLFEPAKIKYGKTHESIARRAYANYMKEKNHTNLKVEETGFIVSLIHPQLGPSPDGIVTCKCCESGCLEIKFPFLLKDGTKSISEFADMKSTCLIKNENVIIPEILGRWYTQQKNNCFEIIQVFCDCQRPDNGKEMVQCANSGCSIQWFHLEFYLCV